MEQRVCDAYKDVQEFVRLLSTAAKCAETPCEKAFVASMVSRFAARGERMPLSFLQLEHLERIAYSDT